MAGRKGGFPGRESKKPKQNAKKSKGVGSILNAPAPVEVVKNRKPPKPERSSSPEEEG